MSRPLVIAHRGDSSRALENSIEAFRLALAAPVDMIEFDVRKSRDNVLYVMHDKETGRTADGNIDIERSTSDEIALIKLKNREPVPTLAEALAFVAGRAGVNIEIKSEGAGGLTAAHLAGSGYRGSLLLSSFHEREVLDARRIMPDVPVSGIFDVFAPSGVSAYRAKGYRHISLNRKAVTRELIERCRKAGISVYVWTVDDEEEMKKLISWGVDGIYSNKPGLLRTVVGQ